MEDVKVKSTGSGVIENQIFYQKQVTVNTQCSLNVMFQQKGFIRTFRSLAC